MTFQTLNADLQNILLVNHSYITKWLAFFLIIFFSSYYVFYLWGKQEKSKFFSVVIFRVMVYLCSLSYLIVSPYILFLMTPEYTFNEFITVPIVLYGVLSSIMIILMISDFLRYGFLVMLKMGGLDVHNSNVNEIVNSINNSKHFIKMSNKNGRRK